MGIPERFLFDGGRVFECPRAWGAEKCLQTANPAERYTRQYASEEWLDKATLHHLGDSACQDLEVWFPRKFMNCVYYFNREQEPKAPFKYGHYRPNVDLRIVGRRLEYRWFSVPTDEPMEKALFHSFSSCTATCPHVFANETLPTTGRFLVDRHRGATRDG